MVSVRHVLTLIVFGVYTTKCEPELGAGARRERRQQVRGWDENLAHAGKTDPVCHRLDKWSVHAQATSI